MPASTSVSGGGASMQQDTLLGGFVARGPAIQRLLVVGPTMGGKRTFVDRLRSSSEASNTADQHDGSPRRLHGRQPREQPQPYKTLHGVHHGCSMHFTSIAYHYSLDASRRALQGQQAAAPPSTTSASEPTISLNNTVMEVLVCDTPETLLQAMPTDPEQLLNSTAVVIALSATEVYSVSHDLGLWTKAVNDAVTTVVSKHNSRVAAAKKHANSHHSGGAGSSSGGRGGSGQKRPATAASLDSAIGTTFDIRRLSEARLEEADVAEAALGGEVKEAFLQASRSHKDWTEPAKDKSVEGGGVPEFPESGKCLLPSLVLLSKMDVLEEICKKPQNVAGPGTPLTSFQAAVQHSRWQALQRGAAFAAISNKGFSNATTAVFDALWRYVAFALFPQRRVQEHLKAMRRQERKKLLQTAGRHAVAAGGDDGGDSEEDAKELEEGARKEIDEAVAAARQQHRAEEGGETGSAAAESPRFFAGEESTIVNPVMNTTGGGASHDQQAANYLKAIITSNTIKSSLNAVASQTVFIPMGLDDPTWLYNESFPSRWLHMYGVFKAIRTTTTEAGGADDNKEPSSSSHANKHPGRARLELFAKIMADALGASALPNNNSVSSPVTSQSMTPMPTATAIAASNNHHQESATTSTSDAPAVATANSSVSAGGGNAAASTSQPPPASSGGADGAAPAGDDELVWDEL